MKLDKIRAAAEFLRTVPTHLFSASETDENYKQEAEALEKIADIMPEGADGYTSVFRLTDEYDGEDGRLRKLTLLAESDDKEVAADACWQLAEMYLGRNRPKDFLMPISAEIAAGFYAKALRLGHTYTQSRYVDVAESLGYYNSVLHYLPEMKYEYDIRKTFNLHRVRMAEQFGGKLPELDEFGLVLENESEEKQKLKEALKGYNAKRIESYMPIRRKLEAIENSLSEKVLKLKETLDKEVLSLSKSKKRGKRLRWLVALLLIAAMVPGFIMGPGEGIQGLLYLLFLLPCTMNVLTYNEISSFKDYMNAMPTVEERTTIFTVTAVLILIACAVLNFLIFLFSRKGENNYKEYKSELYKKYGLGKAVKEANAVIAEAKKIDEKNAAYLKTFGIKDSDNLCDELAIMYHAYCFCKEPYKTYYRLISVDRKWEYSYKVPQWIYDAHEGIGRLAAGLSDAKIGEVFAAKYFGYELDEYGHIIGSFSNRTYEIDENGKMIPVSTDYYTDYEKSVGIECLFAEYLTGESAKIKGYPWSAKDMWAQFVGGDCYHGEISPDLFREYFENVADSAFLKASENGDAEAKCLLAEALYPSERGFELAKVARKEGAQNGFDVYWKYEKYFNPPEEYDYEVSYDTSSSSSDPDPWGFKAWASEAADKAIRRNNWEIGAAYSRGDIDADTYSKLMDQYGDHSKLGDPW